MAPTVSYVKSTIQTILDRMQTMLKGSTLDNTSRMNMDFQVNKLGQMHLSLQRSGADIAVSLEVGSESSRQQLMNQRDELAQQIRLLGYKEVSVDISNSNDPRRQAPDLR